MGVSLFTSIFLFVDSSPSIGTDLSQSASICASQFSSAYNFPSTGAGTSPSTDVSLSFGTFSSVGIAAS